jgi:hypothetical protein
MRPPSPPAAALALLPLPQPPELRPRRLRQYRYRLTEWLQQTPKTNAPEKCFSVGNQPASKLHIATKLSGLNLVLTDCFSVICHFAPQGLFKRSGGSLGARQIYDLSISKEMRERPAICAELTAITNFTMGDWM